MAVDSTGAQRAQPLRPLSSAFSGWAGGGAEATHICLIRAPMVCGCAARTFRLEVYQVAAPQHSNAFAQH